jgi:hypothetical protein
MEAMGDFIPGLVERPAVPVLSDLAGTAGAVERAEGMADAGNVAGAVEGALALLRSSGGSAVADAALFGMAEASGFAGRVEELSRTVDYLQLVAAAAVERARSQAAGGKAAAAPFGSGAPAGWLTGWNTEATSAATPAPGATATTTLTSTETSTGWNGPGGPEAGQGLIDDGYRSATEFLRARLRISAPEARRRLALAAEVLPSTGFTGQPVAAVREELGAVLASGEIGSRAGTLISLSLDRIRHVAAPAAQEQMEHALVRTAVENDQDFLTRIARRWTEALDQDGAEPGEQELRQRQGAFIRRSHRGLQHLEIFATAEQFEYLLTVMNTATNPRTGPGFRAAAAGSDGQGGDTGREEGAGPGHGSGAGADGEGAAAEDAAAERLDPRTRPQRLLDGLVGGCQVALAAGDLPAAGGLRPQVMVTIDYRDIMDRIGAADPQTHPQPRAPGAGAGSLLFTGPVTASTVRKIACDADIIPVLLGGNGRVLDIGRASRVFPPHIRKALTARDGGCAFPGCTIPAPWCEAHHITYWSRGGSTGTDNGVLLCSSHHHVIHKENWTIQLRTGIPWFIPPPHLDPGQKPRRNTYFQLE